METAEIKGLITIPAALHIQNSIVEVEQVALAEEAVAANPGAAVHSLEGHNHHPIGTVRLRM